LIASLDRLWGRAGSRLIRDDKSSHNLFERLAKLVEPQLRRYLHRRVVLAAYHDDLVQETLISARGGESALRGQACRRKGADGKATEVAYRQVG
jgi:hypothetical protein